MFFSRAHECKTSFANNSNPFVQDFVLKEKPVRVFEAPRSPGRKADPSSTAGRLRNHIYMYPGISATKLAKVFVMRVRDVNISLRKASNVTKVECGDDFCYFITDGALYESRIGE